ncbi:hypothetical protein ACWEKT_29630 [Nocardia takedensis]
MSEVELIYEDIARSETVGTERGERLLNRFDTGWFGDLVLVTCPQICGSVDEVGKAFDPTRQL